jgi:dTDP-4-dehydrorhamnose 3,5-epimerase
MGNLIINSIKLTSLKKFPKNEGDVYHAMKITDIGFSGFGEAYFSFLEVGCIKAWKLHLSMTLNLVVPIGVVRFVCAETINGPFREFHIDSNHNYARLTIPPGIWLGMQNINFEKSIILNLANLIHDEEEVKKIGFDEIEFDWEKK